MKEGDLLLIVAVIAVAVSVVAAGITYFSVANLVTKISGFATGEANLTVETSATVNFTTNSINWSSGRTNATFAVLDTIGVGTVTNGNWTADGGFIIENIGNNNVTFNISVAKTAASFIGGTRPIYEWNISAVEAGSCLNDSCGTIANNDSEGLDNFVNTSTTETYGCGCFPFASLNDTLRIDLNITIPEDSSTGDLGDVLTATIVSIT